MSRFATRYGKVQCHLIYHIGIEAELGVMSKVRGMIAAPCSAKGFMKLSRRALNRFEAGR